MALHVYGVVAAATPLPGVLRGRQEAAVRLVVRGDLAAVVSEIDADAGVRRDDLLAHARVLETLVEGSTVLPMRFGVIVETDEGVAHNILEAGENRLTSL
jgi:Gas vesicle synthesis protein GvpL/GvpF